MHIMSKNLASALLKPQIIKKKLKDDLLTGYITITT